jgi:hypothetical protein
MTWRRAARWARNTAIIAAVALAMGAKDPGCDSGGGYGHGHRAEAKRYAQSYSGWSHSQMHGCLIPLWRGESHWNQHDVNPSSGAYGIPQALPKYTGGIWGAFSEDDWQGQVRWGVDYIKERYGDPCSAWSFWLNHDQHWY